LKQFPDTNTGWISCEFLYDLEKHTDDGIQALFEALDAPLDILLKLSDGQCVDSLINDIQSNTKITSLLRKVVCNFPSPESIKYINSFYEERQGYFSRSGISFSTINNIVSEVGNISNKFDIKNFYGLVHGDFKPKNILAYPSGDYKLIDFQHYTYGIRVWDLSFYYSRDKREFNSIIKTIEEKYCSLRIFPILFVFFYMIASTIHIKEKNHKKIINKKFKPAIDYLALQLNRFE
jgi:serine/threonine protein kinase